MSFKSISNLKKSIKQLVKSRPKAITKCNYDISTTLAVYFATFRVRLQQHKEMYLLPHSTEINAIKNLSDIARIKLSQFTHAVYADASVLIPRNIHIPLKHREAEPADGSALSSLCGHIHFK